MSVGRRRSEIDGLLTTFSGRVEEHGFARISSWPMQAPRALLSELESLRRLEVLSFELDEFLARVPAGAAQSATSIATADA